MDGISPAALFNLANPAALLGWISLTVWLFLPAAQRQRTRWIGLVIPLVLSCLYTAAMLTWFSGSEGGFDSLENVMLLFTQPGTVLAGWVHYLAFDLFVGWCIALDATSRRISRWFVLPVFGFTFMLGPMGLLLYAATRAGYHMHPTAGGEPA